MSRFLPAAALLGCLIAAPAIAQESDAASEKPPRLEADAGSLDDDRVTIGLGVGAVPSYEGSNDTAISIVPAVLARVSGFTIVLRGNRLYADAVPNGSGPGWDFQLGPMVQLNFNRHVSILDPQVKRLGKLGIAVETGGWVGIARQGVITSDYDTLGLSVSYLKDLAGVHGSYVVTPAIDYGTPLSRTAYVDVNLSADYVGDGYAYTYFSVSPAGSAASGLPVFTARRGWKDWTVAGLGMVSLTGDLTHGIAAVGSVSYRRMLDDAALSPITSVAGSRNQWSGVVGLAYTF